MLATGQYVGNGRYELLRMLDKGGMSSVWLAKDSRLHERVALKFLPPEISRDPAALREMQRETTKSRQLSHPNIIRIYDLHESPDEAPFISMEFIEGENLHYLIQSQPQGIFTWEQIKPWVKQLCDALTYAHGEGVIHRDLKPANMMLDAKGRLKLADFGIAMSVNESEKKSDVVLVSGTPAYMSPQQHSGQPAHITDDIYSLGATLYELLTGRPPFHTGDIKTQALQTSLKPLSASLWEQGLTNEIPPDVSALIMACLAKDPSQRPANAEQVSQWIGLKTEFAIAEESSGITSSYLGETTPPPSRRKRGCLIAAGISFALLLAVVAILARAKPQIAESQPSTYPVIKDFGATSNSMAVPIQTAKKNPAKMPGTLDESFNPSVGPNGTVLSMVRQPDGKILLAGSFTKVGTTDRNRIARFNTDGSLDETFGNNTGVFDREIFTIALQADGKVLAGGQFIRWNDQKQEHIARLNRDGSLDKTFLTQVPVRLIASIVPLPNGKILIGGRFTRLEPNGVKRNRIARLNPDGTVDDSFKSGDGAEHAVNRIAIQNDGRIVIGGIFPSFDKRPYAHLARLMADGALDTTFKVGSGLNEDVLALEIQPDGKILVGGSFTVYNGVRYNRIIRLLPDGTPDPAFKAGGDAGANGAVTSIRFEGASRILVAGHFTEYNGTPCSYVVRLKLDGSIDPDFATGPGANATIRTVFHVPQEGLFATGDFTSFDGVPRPRLLKLYSGILTSSKD